MAVTIASVSAIGVNVRAKNIRNTESSNVRVRMDFTDQVSFDRRRNWFPERGSNLPKGDRTSQ